MNPYMNQNAYPQGMQPFNPSAAQQQPQQQQYGTQPQYAPQPQFGVQGNMPQMPQQQGGYEIPMPQDAPMKSTQAVAGMLPSEESYIENILRLNKGKLATVYMTFENNKEWNALTVKGIIEAAGRDHLIISDPQTGKRYLFPMVYLDYITFDEEIEYESPFKQFPGLSNYPPRY